MAFLGFLPNFAGCIRFRSNKEYKECKEYKTNVWNVQIVNINAALGYMNYP